MMGVLPLPDTVKVVRPFDPAVDYFIGFWKKIDHASQGRRKPRASFVLSRRKKSTAKEIPEA